MVPKLSHIELLRINPETQYPLQNADFSVDTIKELIKQGETKALDYLK